MDKKPEKLVPEVRFKGFTDDWELRKLEEIAEFYNGDRGPNYPKPSEIVEQGVPFINAGDLINGHIDYHNCKHITSDKFNQLNGAKLKINDIVYCLRGTIGKNGLVNSGANATIASSLVCIRPVKLRPLFLFQILNSSIEERQRKMVDEGAAQPNISATNLKKFLIPVPNDNEQEKIGEVFSKLNHLITLQQRKLEQLMQLKKAMLQQLFVDKNCKQPILRFKNFNDNWEERKLSDIANYRNGKAHEQYIDMNGIYTVVNSKFISTNGKVKKFSNKPIELLKKGEIAFVLSDVPNGKALAKAYLIDSDNRYSLNQRIAGITPSSDINSYFLYILINRNRYFLKFDDGVGQTNLSKKDIEEFKENYPLFDEQQKIANLFSKIQILITLQQNKLTQLTTLKEYLLRKLFI